VLAKSEKRKIIGKLWMEKVKSAR